LSLPPHHSLTLSPHLYLTLSPHLSLWFYHPSTLSFSSTLSCFLVFCISPSVSLPLLSSPPLLECVRAWGRVGGGVCVGGVTQQEKHRKIRPRASSVRRVCTREESSD